MAIATLTIDIVAKLANLQTSFDKAAQLSERNAKRMENAFKSAGSALKTVFAGFGTQQLIQAFNTAADGLSKFKDVAEQTGIAVEELSKLEPVARGAGLQLDQVGTISLKLSKALSGVDDESRGAGKALAQIGINLAQFRNLGAADQMQALAKALNNYADDANKAAIGQAILGRNWQQAAPFLKDLAEAGTLNATVTKEQAAAADEYNKNLAKMQQNIVGVARALVSELVPAINQAFDRFRQIDFDKVFGAGPLPGMMLREYGRQLDEINKKERERAAALAGSAGAYDEVERLLKRSPKASAGPFVAAAESAAKARREVKQFNDEFERSLSRERLSLSDWLGLRDIKDAEESFRRVQQQIERINDLTGRSAANKLAADLALIDDAFFAGKISIEEYDNALRKVTGTTDQLKQETEKVDDIARDLGMTFSSAFEDAIVGGKSLKDVLRGLEQDIIRIITRKLVTEPLANAVGGINFGSIFGSLFGGARASGGPVSSGSAYLVGEKGPELFVPKSGGQIVPNGRGMGNNITINLQGNATRETANQIASQVSRALSVSAARGYA